MTGEEKYDYTEDGALRSDGEALYEEAVPAHAVQASAPGAHGGFSGRLSSRRMAAFAVCVVIVFAFAFMGAMTVLTAVVPNSGLGARDQEIVAQTDPFYVLLIGSDSRKGTALYTGKASQHAQVDQHSDVLTLVRVDPAAFKLTLLSVPRDTQLSGQSEKINQTLATGDPTQTVAAVEELTGVQIPYYMMTTFTGFQRLVDQLGGVVVDVPSKVTVQDPASGRDLTVSAGQDQTLNGAQALVFARARKEYSDYQDATRQQNVRELERSIIEKVLGYPVEAVIESTETEGEDAAADVDTDAGADASESAGAEDAAATSTSSASSSDAAAAESAGEGAGADSGSGTGAGADASEDAGAGADASESAGAEDAAATSTSSASSSDAAAAESAGNEREGDNGLVVDGGYYNEDGYWVITGSYLNEDGGIVYFSGYWDEAGYWHDYGDIEPAVQETTEIVISPQLVTAIAELQKNTTTNMPIDFLTSVVVYFVSHASDVVIYSATGPYEGDVNASGQWVVPQDAEAWEALMARVDAGEDPSRRYTN